MFIHMERSTEYRKEKVCAVVLDGSQAEVEEMIVNKRTAGDGMESKTTPETLASISLKAETSSPPQKKISQPAGRLIQMIPKKPFIVQTRKQQNYSKSPKFVPYEPYPAAVKPILPHGKLKDSKKSKNNMDINLLISQMSQMDTRPSEFKPRVKHNSQTEKQTDVKEWNKEKADMQGKIDQLMNENEALKDQVKQQVQVNKELKTMLVASMGEDLETQVQSLNDDKRHLADALLSSAQHLSTHQEQTEWLAGQCEVWRSKFLASSLMVAELANWKHVLSQRTDDLQQAIKQILEERCRVREMSLYTYRNLCSIHKNWLENIAIAEYREASNIGRPIGNLNMSASVPQTINLLDLASVNLKMSENISSSFEKCDVGQLSKLSMETDAEKYAEQIMAKPVDIKRANETPVNALVSHAHNRCSTTTPPIASCVHCNGQVQLL